ncbi:hypothetical protein G6L26_009590 [Agrobacterium radiobacter]|uniref:hypothetical protein n=1 Tax=Agrobacterium tumefaciens complex TaxID=1183400 RepID=UPI0011475FA6|nr:hypothetical protein [Agrobacterium tumefaciens]NTA05437.1 hypothetical protein [Agrobacterium tumefaciens]NTA92030.1 hypothetical protein [Agrobacterium tumefaciens]
MDDAWIEGANAAYDGKSRSANPYSSAHSFSRKDLWNEGWLYAAKRIAIRKIEKERGISDDT